MSRIGVFICHCGLNIAKTVRVSELAEFAATLPDVVVAKDYKFMCSTPGQEMIQHDITKSSALSCWSIRHMASTYSGAQPQSR